MAQFVKGVIKMFSKDQKSRFDANPMLSEISAEIEKIRAKIPQLETRAKGERSDVEASQKFILLNAALIECDQLIMEVNKSNPSLNTNDERRYTAKILVQLLAIFAFDEPEIKALNKPKNNNKAIANWTWRVLFTAGATATVVCTTGGIALPIAAFFGADFISVATINNLGFDPKTETASIVLNILLALVRNLQICVKVLLHNKLEFKDWSVKVTEKSFDELVTEGMTPNLIYIYKSEDDVVSAFLDKDGHPMKFILDPKLVNAQTYLSTSSLALNQQHTAIMIYAFIIQYSALCDELSLDYDASSKSKGYT